MVNIKNVVILGDSMSDIGNKWTWPSGEMGRAIGAMRVNEVGRFSDGKNWTDFLVEYSSGRTLMWGDRQITIRNSSRYLTLSGDSSLEEEDINYVNYAMGGAIVTTDWTFAPKFGALTYLRDQVQDYIAQRRNQGTRFRGPTLHVIWIGLNDFVTVLRPDYDPNKATHLPATTSYQDWLTWSQNYPRELSNGVGAFPAVREIQSLVELINSSFPDYKGDHYFMVIDLPSVYNAIRYMAGLATPAKIQEAQKIEPVVNRYNAILQSLLSAWPAGAHAPAGDHRALVRMGAWMNSVSANLDAWRLSRQAQPRGVKPYYNPGIPPQKPDPVPPAERRAITTSDLGHPTQAVYAIMARFFVTEMLRNDFHLGRLDSMEAWKKGAPFKDLPFQL
jgi:phospholipase/lecithinase/hemolysin